MAQTRKSAKEAVRKNNSLKRIFRNAIANDDYTKWNVVTTMLWAIWFKFLRALKWLLKWMLIVLGVLIWMVCCSIIAAAVVGSIITVMLVTSPVWMPFRLWKTPQKVAHWLLNTEYEKLDDPVTTPMVFGANAWLCGIKLINWVWKPVYNRLPMSYRKYFIAESNKELKDYPLDVQVKYYDVQTTTEKKVATLKAMKHEAMREVWNRGNAKDRAYILKGYYLSPSDGELLFCGDEENFKLLKIYCANEKNKLYPELQMFFVEQLNASDKLERAYEVLKICCENRPMANEALIQMVKMLECESPAESLLNLYWDRYTFSDEVVKSLIEVATGDFVDKSNRHSFDLLLKVARRAGLSTELAELFFSHCSINQDAAMTKILNERTDIQLIDWECVGETNQESVKKLTEYFSIREDVSVEGQKLLREWQYDLYKATNHKLAEEAISYLLVKRLKESDLSFFMKVLNEAEESNALSDTDAKLMALTPWKRNILIERFAKQAKDEAIA